MLNEQWKPVRGFEHYSVSDAGRIRNDRTQHLIKPRESRGYLRVNLSDVGRHETRQVHRVVAEAFLGPISAGLHTCHLDGDSHNNVASNLKYATIRENVVADRRRHGTMPLGSRNGRAKLSEEQVKMVRAAALTNAALAKTLGVSPQLISQIKAGRIWTHV